MEKIDKESSVTVHHREWQEQSEAQDAMWAPLASLQPPSASFPGLYPPGGVESSGGPRGPTCYNVMP